MNEQSATVSDAPCASEFTSSPLRNRLRLELDAPVSRVWELMGDLSRFPEYSVGLERVEAETDDTGRCLEYTCYFKPVEEGSEGAVSRDLMKWYEPNRGYLSVEAEGDGYLLPPEARLNRALCLAGLGRREEARKMILKIGDSRLQEQVDRALEAVGTPAKRTR